MYETHYLLMLNSSSFHNFTILFDFLIGFEQIKLLVECGDYVIWKLIRIICSQTLATVGKRGLSRQKRKLTASIL